MVEGTAGEEPASDEAAGKEASSKKPRSTGFFASIFGPAYELGKGRVVMISGCRDDQTSGDAKVVLG